MNKKIMLQSSFAEIRERQDNLKLLLRSEHNPIKLAKIAFQIYKNYKRMALLKEALFGVF